MLEGRPSQGGREGWCEGGKVGGREGGWEVRRERVRREEVRWEEGKSRWRWRVRVGGGESAVKGCCSVVCSGQRRLQWHLLVKDGCKCGVF